MLMILMSKLSLRRCTGAWERCRELRESGADPGLPLLASLGWCFTRENVWTSCKKKSRRRSLLVTIYGTFAPWLTRYGPISLSTQRLIFHSRHFTTKSHLISSISRSFRSGICSCWASRGTQRRSWGGNGDAAVSCWVPMTWNPAPTSSTWGTLKW